MLVLPCNEYLSELDAQTRLRMPEAAEEPRRRPLRRVGRPGLLGGAAELCRPGLFPEELRSYVVRGPSRKERPHDATGRHE